MRILLENGADVSAAGNIHHNKSVDYFRGSGMIEKFGLILGEFGILDDVFPLFVTAAFVGEDSIVHIFEVLLSAGADVNQRTAVGQTALHILCATWDGHHQTGESSTSSCESVPLNGKIRSMMTLINHGADVNSLDDFGKAPIHYAAEAGFSNFVRVLLDKGANIYLEDKMGLNVLDYVSHTDHILTVALIDKYDFPMKLVIEAYECAAMKTERPVEMLRKATYLRKVHNLPKVILPPLGCYSFQKEWETIEELEKFDNKRSQVIQSILARDRTCIQRYNEIAPHLIARCKYLLKCLFFFC